MAPSQKSAHNDAKRANGVKKPPKMVPRKINFDAVKAVASVKGRPIPVQEVFDISMPPTNSGHEKFYRNTEAFNFCKNIIEPLTLSGNTCPCPDLNA